MNKTGDRGPMPVLIAEQKLDALRRLLKHLEAFAESLSEVPAEHFGGTLSLQQSFMDELARLDALYETALAAYGEDPGGRLSAVLEKQRAAAFQIAGVIAAADEKLALLSVRCREKIRALRAQRQSRARELSAPLSPGSLLCGSDAFRGPRKAEKRDFFRGNPDPDSPMASNG